MMNKLLRAVSISAVVCASIGAAAQRTERQPSNRSPLVHGVFTDEAHGRGVFTGTITIAKFESRDGGIVALGRLTGSLADSEGTTVGAVDQAAILPVGGVSSTCEALRMELGPADGELLGEDVHLEKDVLRITARDGHKESLTGLLCAAARLLDKRPSSNAVAATLNEVLKGMSKDR